MKSYVREALPSTRSGPTPREKLERHGAESLRDGELLVLLGIPEKTAGPLLKDSSLVELFNSPVSRLQHLVGQTNASRLLAGLEMSKRLLQNGLGILPVVSCPSETVPFLAEYRDRKKEHFIGLFLNARHQVIHQEVISVGSLSASIVHPREIFAVAVAHSAASIILAHNHPSADVSPSQDDIDLTRRLVRAGELMGIEILDHLIIGTTGYLSLKEQGLF